MKFKCYVFEISKDNFVGEIRSADVHVDIAFLHQLLIDGYEIRLKDIEYEVLPLLRDKKDICDGKDLVCEVVHVLQSKNDICDDVKS